MPLSNRTRATMRDHMHAVSDTATPVSTRRRAVKVWGLHGHAVRPESLDCWRLGRAVSVVGLRCAGRCRYTGALGHDCFRACRDTS